MIVGINLVDYVLVAADKREVLLVDRNVDHVISDSANKIIDWHSGYITGSGYVLVLNELKEAVSNSKISHTNEIIELAVGICKSFANGDSLFLESSNWMFTYVTDTDTGNKPRIGIVNAKAPAELRVLDDMTSTIWAKIPDLDSAISELNNKLKEPNEFSNVEESITYHVSLLNEIFTNGAMYDETVCSKYDCCIQLKDGSKGMRVNA
jgi:hypothetical protein